MDLLLLKRHEGRGCGQPGDGTADPTVGSPAAIQASNPPASGRQAARSQPHGGHCRGRTPRTSPPLAGGSGLTSGAWVGSHELALPVGTPVRLDITSATVMNAIFMPGLAGQIYAMAALMGRGVPTPTLQ